MKKIFKNILLASAALPLIASCASQDEVKRLQYQLHVVNKRLEEMKSTTVGDLQKRQAASASQMDQLEQEIIMLRSELEETSFQNNRLKKQNDSLEKNISEIAREEAQRREEALRKIEQEQLQKEARIAELNDKLRIQEENLQAIQDARVREAERRAKEAKMKAEAARAKALAASTSGSSRMTSIKADKQKRIFQLAPQTRPAVQTASVAPSATRPKNVAKTTSQPPKPVVKETKPATPKPVASASSSSPLGQAQQLFKQKQYDKAYSSFSKVASANAGNDTGVTASYMMGECLFEQKEYDKAILQYQKIISQNSSHPKAAAATLKQAMAFELLADNETAKMIYKKIVNHYSASPEAAVAKEKLANM